MLIRHWNKIICIIKHCGERFQFFFEILDKVLNLKIWPKIIVGVALQNSLNFEIAKMKHDFIT